MKKQPFLLSMCLILALSACEKPKINDPILVNRVTIDSSSQSITLTVAETRSLHATVDPEDASNPKIAWRSADESTATVTPSGVITGVRAGSTQVYAYSVENTTIQDKCEVTVVSAVIAVTGLVLDSTTLTLEVNQTKPLSVSVMPENASLRTVSWFSSDSTVATVSRTGRVTGLRVGTATITVRSDSDSTMSERCELTVTEASIPATDMWMKTGKIDLKVGQSQALVAVTIPTNATVQSFVWSSDNETVVTVDNTGLITGSSAGTATVWVKWGPDHSIKDKCTVTVLAESAYAVGDLYPNAENPTGVVFWKDPNNPAKGKIVSLNETRIEWAQENVITNALDEIDGMVNMEIIQAIVGWAEQYSAFKWCADKGIGWYLPAIAEMKAIYDTKEIINAAILATSVSEADSLDYKKDYWTSSERKLSPKSNAVTIQFYKGFGGGGAAAGGTSFASKDGKNNTRAIMKFDKYKE